MILDIQTYFEVTLVKFGIHCMKINKKGKEKWLSGFHTAAFAKIGNTKGEVRIFSNIFLFSKKGMCKKDKIVIILY